MRWGGAGGHWLVRGIDVGWDGRSGLPSCQAGGRAGFGSVAARPRCDQRCKGARSDSHCLHGNRHRVGAVS